MSELWLNWILLVSIFGIAVIAPGPDFVIAVRNAILYSRKAGIFTAAGFALGVCVHIFYTLVGIAAVISQSIVLFSLIKYAGAAYLFYIGFKALKSKGFQADSTDSAPEKRNLSAGQALWSGFLTNLLNPKATLFFLAIFTQFIGPQTPLAAQMFYGLSCALMTFGWFSLVTLVLTNPRLKSIFLRASRWIDRICGTLMIGLGLRLAFTKGNIPS